MEILEMSVVCEMFVVVVVLVKLLSSGETIVVLKFDMICFCLDLTLEESTGLFVIRVSSMSEFKSSKSSFAFGLTI